MRTDLQPGEFIVVARRLRRAGMTQESIVDALESGDIRRLRLAAPSRWSRRWRRTEAALWLVPLGLIGGCSVTLLSACQGDATATTPGPAMVVSSGEPTPKGYMELHIPIVKPGQPCATHYEHGMAAGVEYQCVLERSEWKWVRV